MVEEFEGKNFDKITLEYLNNFLYEFDALFGKYVSREEVIRRIRENLDKSFIFKDDLGDEIGGQYSKTEKTITLKSGFTPDTLKSIVFHELIHCITTKGIDTGFSREYSSEEFDRSVFIGRGINEGSTEYLTVLRDKKFAPDLNRIAYPVLVENVKYLIDIIGEEKYINIFLNSSGKIIDTLCEVFDYEDESSAHDFIRHLDYIYNNGKRLRNIIAICKIMNMPLNIDDEKDRFTVSKIIETYCRGHLKKKIDNVSDYTVLYDTIKQFMGFFDVIRLDIFDALINKALTLASSYEEAIKMFPENISQIIKMNNEIKKLDNMPINQRLNEISNKYMDMLNDIMINDDYEVMANIFRIKMMNSLYLDNSFKNLDDICALSKIITDRGLNFGNLSIDIFQDQELLSEKLYCLYKCDQEKKQPVGLVLCDSENTVEMKLVDSVKREKLINQYNGKIAEEDEIYEDEQGDIIISTPEGEYYLKGHINEEVLQLDNIGYIKSNYEVLYNRKMNRERRIKKLEKLNAPPIILEHERKMMEEVERLMREIMGADYGDNAENVANEQEELDER